MGDPNSTKSKLKNRRNRNYKAERQARLTRAAKLGKSRGWAYGHPTVADLPKPSGPIDRQSALEKALARMKHGATQKAAAKSEGVSAEKLRLYRLQNTTSQRQGRGWTIFDLRHQPYRFPSGGKMKIVTLTRDEGSLVRDFRVAVNKFLGSQDLTFLSPFVGKGVRDVKGQFHEFETRQNTLRKMEAMGDLNYIDIYADTTTEA